MNRERGERRKLLEKFSFGGIQVHRSAAVRAGARRVRRPLDPLVSYMVASHKIVRQQAIHTYKISHLTYNRD